MTLTIDLKNEEVGEHVTTDWTGSAGSMFSLVQNTLACPGGGGWILKQGADAGTLTKTLGTAYTLSEHSNVCYVGFRLYVVTKAVVGIHVTAKNSAGNTVAEFATSSILNSAASFYQDDTTTMMAVGTLNTGTWYWVVMEIRRYPGSGPGTPSKLWLNGVAVATSDTALNGTRAANVASVVVGTAAGAVGNLAYIDRIQISDVYPAAPVTPSRTALRRILGWL